MSVEIHSVRQIIHALIQREGDYVDHAHDRGGPTRYGITEATARRNGYDGDMEDLPLGVAFDIYSQEYWVKPGYAEIEKIDLPIAVEMFDTAVMSGPVTAGRFLQRALNAFNRDGRDYPDLKIDGIPGSVTRAALQTFLRIRGDAGSKTLLMFLNCQQGVYLMQLAEADPTQQDFMFGWAYHRVTLPAYAELNPYNRED